MKKVISLIIVICLILSMPITAFAGENDSRDLEQAIFAVKKVVEIPDSFSEFSYYSYETVSEYGSGKFWNLSWNDADNKASIYAAVDWKGNLISYEKYVYSDESGLAKVSRNQAAMTARAFLDKAIPGFADSFREINAEDSKKNTYGHQFEFGLFINDIYAAFVNVTVRVDKYTGEVVYYGGLPSGFESAPFPDAGNIIDIETAKQALLDETGIALSYYSYYDYKNKKLKIFPAYHLSDNGMVIDAVTGMPEKLYKGDIWYRGGLNEAAKDIGGMGGQISLSEEEIKEIEKLGDLLTKEEAAEIIKKEISNKKSSLELISASLSRNETDKETYVWNIVFNDAYGSADALTGELLSLSNYESEDTGRRNLSEESAMKASEAFLKRVIPEKFAECKLFEDPGYYDIFDQDESERIYYTFNYKRQANGINFMNNGISVTVNKKTGNINYYSCDWYNKAVFPSIENIITVKEMADIMADAGDYGLVYQKVGEKGDIKLVYDFNRSFKGALYSPENGSRIEWNGEEYKYISRPEYSDISGHWCEDTVLELIENGYYLTGDYFNPDGSILQINFFRYLFTPETNYYNDDELYQMLEYRKIIKEGEKAPEKKLTRQDAAKFAIRYLGLDLAALHPEIFINRFKDRINDDYKGYAALCYGLDIIKGDDKGRFNGSSAITNAEAAVVIYNTLKVK